MRATVREGGRSYPVRRYPSCLSAARPARDRAFYVPRLVLGVGTPRARNSECHSRHSFTHNACSTHRFPRYCTATWMSSVDAKKKRVPKGTLSKWRLPVADTILVYVPKLRFSSKYSDVLRSPHRLEICGGPDGRRVGSIATYTKKPGILRYRASESGGYLLSHNAVQYHRRC